MIIIPAVIVVLGIMAYAVTVYSSHMERPGQNFGPLVMNTYMQHLQ